MDPSLSTSAAAVYGICRFVVLVFSVGQTYKKRAAQGPVIHVRSDHICMLVWWRFVWILFNMWWPLGLLVVFLQKKNPTFRFSPDTFIVPGTRMGPCKVNALCWVSVGECLCIRGLGCEIQRE